MYRSLRVGFLVPVLGVLPLVVGCPGPVAPVSDDAAPPAEDVGTRPDAVALDAAVVDAPDGSADVSAACVDDDVDGDGFPAIACGGNDCDDSDALRHPGNVERCDGLLSDGRDAADHDEDCDACTVAGTGADGDLDADLHPASACSNPWLDAAAPIACDASTTVTDATTMTVAGSDCDDARSDVYTGLVEACDGFDNDCDAVIDEGVTQTVYRDADGDLHGDPAVSTTADCTIPLGYVLVATDCDDTRGDRNPTTVEACDGVDNDCDIDLAVDEGVGSVWHPDTDSDGQGSPTGATVMQCFAPPGFVANTQDCDDARRDVGTGFSEACDLRDNDCDGTVDESGGRTYWQDADGDGYGDANRSILVPDCTPPAFHVNNPSDCSDADPSIHPGAIEVCDGRDNDCSSGALAMGLDRSEDADGDLHAPLTATCVGGAFPRDDCNDGNDAVRPGASEMCDGLDNDCSTGGGTVAAEDVDADGHAPIGAACLGGPFTRDDCDDMSAEVHPGAVDLCDRQDGNCSSGGGADPSEDADGDLHASLGASCMGGYPRDDCNDASVLAYLGAPELCDRIDNDCSFGGGADAAEDADLDGHAPTGATCSGGPLPRDDCNDTSASVYGGALEVCDRVDQNCSSGGGADPAEDADGDSHSSPSAACALGFARDDCNDGNGSIFPGAPELCDGLDSDCSAGGGAEPTEDADGDLHVASAATCLGGVLPRDDCNDVLATAYPGAPEICDGHDNDCSSGGGIEASEDSDLDMHAPLGAACTGGPFARDDCNDAEASVYAAAPELCDRLDNDCSTGGGLLAAEDIDLDTHAPTSATCMGGPFPRDDCDDAVATTYAGAIETCDRVDNDCSIGGGVDVGEDADSDLHAPIGGACVGGPLPEDDCDDSDAFRHPGFDAGPTGLSPESGAYTGSMRTPSTLRPTLRWGLPSGGCGTAVYDVQVDESCTTPDFGTCTFPSPVASATGLAVRTFTPPSSLPVSATSPVGRRYYWRVRACEGAICSPWSVRYMEVGRVPSDVNGDGYGDLVVGAHLHNGTQFDEGRAFVYLGSASGLPAAPSTTLSNPAVGPMARPSQYFGSSVATGDVNADGYADALVGAYRQYNSGASDGAVFLYLGNASGIAASPSATLRSAASAAFEAAFGFSVTTGDLSGDGYADVVVGAPRWADTDYRGAAFVYPGTASGLGARTTLIPTLPGGWFGWAVSATGDVNGDGRADLVVGAPGYDASGSMLFEGRGFVYLSSPVGVSGPPTFSLDNPTPASISMFGWGLAQGDMNGDGYADIAVGASERAFVYHGSAAGGSRVPAVVTVADPTFEGALLAADLNRDGLADLYVGRDHVHLGGASGVSAAPSITLGSGGYSASSTDVNGDSYWDLMVGNTDASAGAVGEGGVFVYHGSGSGPPLSPSRIIDSPVNQADGGFGTCRRLRWGEGWF